MERRGHWLVMYRRRIDDARGTAIQLLVVYIYLLKKKEQRYRVGHEGSRNPFTQVPEGS